ncbi:MAG: hypothetical protein J6I76_03270 [Oribacterium sp.]|nr:hypothetical protein [Oribacterium sp.]
MNNIQYTEKIIDSAERIVVDTSTLMARGFRQFVENNKDYFLTNNKKIIVPKAVYTELARHLGSSIPEKSSYAMKSVELLLTNINIFQVENCILSDEEVAHAFADNQLLSELMSYKSDYIQLLLTNDRKLGCDAFELNQQKSCKGRKVFVCFINEFGELQCCDCARPNIEKPKEIITKTVVEPSIKTIKMDDDTNWCFDWESGAIGASCVGIMIGLFKCYKKIFC